MNFYFNDRKGFHFNDCLFWIGINIWDETSYFQIIILLSMCLNKVGCNIFIEDSLKFMNDFEGLFHIWMYFYFKDNGQDKLRVGKVITWLLIENNSWNWRKTLRKRISMSPLFRERNMVAVFLEWKRRVKLEGISDGE